MQLIAHDPADEMVDKLSPSESQALAEIMARVGGAQFFVERQSFIIRRIDELLADAGTFAEIFYDVTQGEVAAMAIIALRDAYREQGQCWDGISAFGDLMYSAARKQAASEWPAHLLAMAPECSDCQYSQFERDPAGTGDSPDAYNCRAGVCPWGRSQ